MYLCFMQDKIKEGWVKAAQEKEEAKDEERRLQKRIDTLEVTQQLQKEQYVYVYIALVEHTDQLKQR